MVRQQVLGDDIPARLGELPIGLALQGRRPAVDQTTVLRLAEKLANGTGQLGAGLDPQELVYPLDDALAESPPDFRAD